MAVDRRQSNSRRDSESNANDRRKKQDRRTESGRREPEKKSVSRKSSSGGKEKKKLSFSLLVKRIAIAFMATVVIATLLMIYFFINMDHYVGKISQKIFISLDRAVLDPESLTDRITRARFNFMVKNTLPLSMVFQNLNFNVNLAGYTVAKGMQASPKVLLAASSNTIVPVSCSVDSIMTRRGLQKALESNPRMLLKGLLGQKNGKVSEDIKSMVKISGTAEFRLKLGGVEIPFTRRLNF
ncbi:MAG: hypothetical protein EOM80_01775 [Erysipelotrichia bacterium]|nr:hypothetical protein [Erysipelotrichia bacterium]